MRLSTTIFFALVPVTMSVQVPCPGPMCAWDMPTLENAFETAGILKNLFKLDNATINDLAENMTSYRDSADGGEETAWICQSNLCPKNITATEFENAITLMQYIYGLHFVGDESQEAVWVDEEPTEDVSEYESSIEL